MKTTLRLDDALVRYARQVALESGLTLSAFVEDALRRSLARSEKSRRFTTFGGRGLLPGVDLGDSAELLDRMDGSE